MSKKIFLSLALCAASILLVIYLLPLQSTQGNKPVRVYVDMVADIFHYGHINFLKQAKKQGDFLIVGIHSDETVKSYKRLPILNMQERIKSVSECKYVDQVVADAPLHITKEWIAKHDIDLVVHGDDSSAESLKLMYGIPISMGIFKAIPYTKGISTSDIIKRIKERDDL